MTLLVVAQKDFYAVAGRCSIFPRKTIKTKQQNKTKTKTKQQKQSKKKIFNLAPPPIYLEKGLDGSVKEEEEEVVERMVKSNWSTISYQASSKDWESLGSPAFPYVRLMSRHLAFPAFFLTSMVPSKLSPLASCTGFSK